MRRILLICSLLVTFIANIHAQYNIERLLEACETALGYQDYVVAIQYCNNIISNRPNLYRGFTEVLQSRAWVIIKVQLMITTMPYS